MSANKINKKLKNKSAPGAKKKMCQEEISAVEQKISALSKVSHLLTVGPDLQEVLRLILNETGKRLYAQWIALWLLDNEGKNISVEASYRLPKDFIDYSKREGKISLQEIKKGGGGGPGAAFRLKNPYLIRDIFKDPNVMPRWIQRAVQKKWPIKGLLSVPLIARGEPVGVMNFFFPKMRKEISPIDIALISVIGNQIGAFVQNSRIYQRLQEGTEDLKKARGALAGMLADTEEARKRAEEEKNKTQSLITNFADGILFFNQENKVSLVNPQAEIFFGVESKHILGKSVLELTAFPQIKPLADLLGNRLKEVSREEIRVGDQVLEVSTVTVMIKTSKLGVMAILHDISREKLIEKMKTEFVSLAAHQLRTPLSAIKWTLKMLLDEDLGKINPEQKKFIEQTYVSNERMISLVNDLLDVTRIEEGKYIYKTALTDIEPIILSAIKSYKNMTDRKKIKVELKKPQEDLPKIKIDVEKIGLVIQNLLDNAVRYTRGGGKITISLTKKEGEIELSIKDSGIGIPKDEQKRIFEKFFRGVGAVRMETEGSGLGLFISKNIIEAHGGKIWFNSQEGKGTALYFTLPRPENYPLPQIRQ